MTVIFEYLDIARGGEEFYSQAYQQHVIFCMAVTTQIIQPCFKVRENSCFNCQDLLKGACRTTHFWTSVGQK